MVSGEAVSVTTTARSRASRRVRLTVTVPPPKAITPALPSEKMRSTSAASRARNAASPSCFHSSGMRLPAAFSISASVSTKATPRRAASAGPTVLLPVAMKPLSTIGRMAQYSFSWDR